MSTTPSTAAEYAAHLQARITEEAATEAPFGYVNTYDDSTADTLEEIVGYDPEEHDSDNLPGHWEKATGHDYLRNVLDIRFVVNSDRSYRDAQICVGLGGPNVWIHTATRTLEVSWGFEHVSAPLPSSSRRSRRRSMGDERMTVNTRRRERFVVASMDWDHNGSHTVVIQDTQSAFRTAKTERAARDVARQSVAAPDLVKWTRLDFVSLDTSDESSFKMTYRFTVSRLGREYR